MFVNRFLLMIPRWAIIFLSDNPQNIIKLYNVAQNVWCVWPLSKTTTCNNMQQMIHKCWVLLSKKFGSFDRGFIGGMLQRTINLYISSFAITRVRVTDTKDARIRKLGNLTVLIVRGHVLLLIKGVLNAKTRHLGSMWWTSKNLMLQP